MLPVILASGSPRRKLLLSKCGVDSFTVIPSGADEFTQGAFPVHLALRNAELKAADIAAKHPDSLVIGCDTIIEFNGRKIGKPADPEDAVRILTMLSGQTHQVVTGVCLLCLQKGIQVQFEAETFVRFKPYSRSVIDSYLSSVPVLDKAGAYGIQEHGDMLVDSIDGSFDNIVGLPTERLTEAIQNINRLF